MSGTVEFGGGLAVRQVALPVRRYYVFVMVETKALESLIDRAASWPEEAQADLLRFMIDTEAKHFGVYRLSDEERTAIRRGLEDAAQGRFATDEQIAELFARFRRTA